MRNSEIQQLVKPILDARTRTERHSIAMGVANTLLQKELPRREIVRAIYDAFKVGHQSYRLTKDDAWDIVCTASLEVTK
ncbi:hypothetical protein ACIPDT_24305 [Escherichia coli]|uniref:hypothetical protein n=1 Tax=Escherichia coli TaxID=562 RepID=UPI003503B0DC|nr:hypothetical protein [Escherichia coli]